MRFRPVITIIKKSLKNFQKGFTLLELLIIIALIGILAMIILIYIGRAKGKARDSHRLAEVNQMETAVETWRYTQGYIPDAAGRKPDANPAENHVVQCNTSGGIVQNANSNECIYTTSEDANFFGDDSTEFKQKNMIKEKMTDPRQGPNCFYLYITDGVDYEIMSVLEEDPDKMANDGGNNDNAYEIGSNLELGGAWGDPGFPSAPDCSASAGGGITHTDYTSLAVACYNFERSSASDPAVDSCGSSNDNMIAVWDTGTGGPGVMTGAGNVRWGSQSADFEATYHERFWCTDETSCPELAGINGSNAEVTIVAWMKPESCPTWLTVYARGWDFFFDTRPPSTLLRFQFKPGPGACSGGTQTLDYNSFTCSSGAWTHVAAVSDSNNLSSYVNGVITSVSPKPYTSGSGLCNSDKYITIGSFEDTIYGGALGPEGDWFDGLYDEIAIFNRALTDQEICEICKFGLDGKQPERTECSCTLP